MQTPWQVPRTTAAAHDGERRWEYAYQFLLLWAMEHEAGNSPAPSHHQEASHGSRSVRPCLDTSAAPAADDCTPTAPPPRLRGAAPRLVWRRRVHLAR